MNTSKNRRIATAASLLLSIMFLVGCTRFTPIKEILDDPHDYGGKTVTIAGQVTEVTGLVFLKYFVVQDKTGKITVITSRPLPKEGAGIKVTGTVREEFAIGDKQVIVIVENEPKKPS